MPTVDIIVPAYNAAHFLPKALDSVVAQTFSDWRILLVDDGSQDRTPEVVVPYRELLGDRLLYIRKQNGGLAAARNTALQHASAEFLALLDADDIWLPKRLEASLEKLQGHPEIGLAYGFVTRIDQDGKLLDTFATRNAHAEGQVARYIYQRSLDLPCPTITFRRACVEQVGGFDESMRATEDRDLWLRIAQRFQIALVPEVIAYYRVSAQAMTTDTDRMLKAQRKFLDKHVGTPHCGTWQRRIALGRAYRMSAETLSDKKQHGKAIASVFQALAYNPFDRTSLKATAGVLLRATGWRAQAPIDPTR